MKPYDQIAFTNEFGQVIQPGQACIIVAKGYSGGISTYKGRYLGVRTYSGWYRSQEPKYQVVAEVEDKKGGYIHPTTGEVHTYDQMCKLRAEGIECKYGYVPVKRITNLWLNLIYPSEFE